MAKDRDKATPAMSQWRDMKDRHPDKILLFRMGDFYETFNEDAVRISRLLGLTLTRRGKDADPTPLAGVPHHQLDRYVRELVNRGEKVVVCDQLEDPARAKGVVKRGITRVATPGTIVEDDILPPRGNNYLAAAAVAGEEIALAFADLSTGEFFVSTPGPGHIEDELERQAPAETLVAREAAADPDSSLRKLLDLGIGGAVTRRDSYHFDPHEGAARLKRHFGVSTLAGFGIDSSPLAIGAAGAVLAYLEETQAASLAHLRPPGRRSERGILVLDRNTVLNLELAAPPRDGGRQSTLLAALDRTRTGPGGRLLRQWLLRPSADLEEIRKRQEAVMELMDAPETRGVLRDILGGIGDMERIMARVATQRANARDLLALAVGCRALPSLTALASTLTATRFAECAAMDCLEDTAGLIDSRLHPEPPAGLRDGGLIRDGFDPEIDELRAVNAGGRDWIAAFQAREQERSGIPSLKVGFNRVFGFYIEITNAHKNRIPPDYVRKQTLVNAERYITPDLKEQEEKVLGAEERLLAREYDLFCALRGETAREMRRVQAAAAIVAVVDVMASLAEAAVEGGYVMPEVHEGIDTVIEGGRHPVAERLMPPGDFVDNDVEFRPDDQRILIVTGPNMAGKSTYIRQVALLFVMAHMGSAIPARSARIGLTDRIFTRVGASDNLSRGLSTFMVEMVETAEILHNAGDRSLIILDEVGRGTSTFDGVSLAWAITEYLHHKVGARTLFATHYHELAELGHILKKAKNFNVAVRDWNDAIIFLRKIRSGACDRSYGIQVARLAGIPAGVIARAGEILAGLESQAAERDRGMTRGNQEILRAAAREVQLELFAPPKENAKLNRELAGELARLDVNRLTPLDAHAFLVKLSERARKG